MKAGYVSGVHSSSEVRRLISAFEKASCGQVLIDAHPEFSKQLKRLIGKLGPGDVLAIWSLDCMAAPLDDLAAFILSLNERGIGFESISQEFFIAPNSTLSAEEIRDRLMRTQSKTRAHAACRNDRPRRTQALQ